MRRSILIGIVALLLVVLGVVGYLAFSGGDDTGDSLTPGGLPAPGDNTLPPGGTQNGGVSGDQDLGAQPVFSPAQKFGLVIKNPVHDYFVDNEGATTAIQPDGRILKVLKNGEMTVLNTTQIANLSHASFSFDGMRILALFGSAAPEISMFDASKKAWQPLELGIKNPTWAPASLEIAYFVERGNDTKLETLDLGTAKPSKPKEILKLHVKDILPQWITKDLVFFKERASASLVGSLWKLNIRTKIFTPVVRGGVGLETIWNTLADRGLQFISNGSGRGGSLRLIDGSGNALHELKIRTLASKCAFGKKSVASAAPQATSSKSAVSETEYLYCAIPRDTEKFNLSILPDDYLKRSIFTIDDLYEINPKDGTATLLAIEGGEPIDAYQLKVFAGKLYFINRFDQKLYARVLE